MEYATGLRYGAQGAPRQHLRLTDRIAAREDVKVHRLVRLLHQPAHERSGQRHHVARLKKGIADREGAHADAPGLRAGFEADEPLTLQRREQPVSAGRRQTDAPRCRAQGEAGLTLREGVQDRKRTNHGLDARGRVTLFGHLAIPNTDVPKTTPNSAW